MYRELNFSLGNTLLTATFNVKLKDNFSSFDFHYLGTCINMSRKAVAVKQETEILPCSIFFQLTV